MKESSIKISKYENGIVRVTLDRPELHNAFDDVMISALAAAFNQLDSDESIRVLILDATGKNFSAGADLNWMKKMAENSYAENYADSRNLAQLMSRLYKMKCTTIAAVQGAAFGGGAGLVACCDIAVASNNAIFCFSEVKLGLIPAVISPYVVKAIGDRAATRYFSTAERFDAKRAVEIGLLSECVDPDELAGAVMSIAESIVKNGPEAVFEAKALIRGVSGKPIDDDLILMTADKIAQIRSSSQGKEGVNAFLSKRKADWDQK
jgi:methylglutaconyl-CoA hydratase